MKKNIRENRFKELWKQIYSMKFTITILIALGIASIIAIILGEFFPANVVGGEEFYLSKLGAARFQIFRLLGVFDPYHSFWYIGLLAVLSLSMTVCTARHIRSVWCAAFGKSYRTSPDEILSLRSAKEIRVAVDSQEATRRISNHLRRKLYRIDFDAKEGKNLLFARRGGVARLGVLLLHFGLVIAVLGGLIATLFGYSEFQWGREGDLLGIPERQFQVRVDGFEILTNARGQVKDYICRVTVVEEETERFTKVIEVNRPLRYKGISIYQSSYRPDPRAIKSATLNVHSPSASTGRSKITVRGESIVPVPGSDYSLQLVDFAGNFRLVGGKVVSVPGVSGFRNPAVKLNVYNAGQLHKSGWVFTPRLSSFHNLLPDFRFELVDFENLYETGLKISKNPGASWIWVGLALMTFGVIVTFYITHKRIWAIVTPTDRRRSSIVLGGVASKNRSVFDNEIKELLKILKGN